MAVNRQCSVQTTPVMKLFVDGHIVFALFKLEITFSISPLFVILCPHVTLTTYLTF